MVQSKGIYHGLLVFPPDLNGLDAIVVGASGIFGLYMLQVLKAPTRWRRVDALSRRRPECHGSNVQHICVDLLEPPEEIAQVLRSAGVRA